MFGATLVFFLWEAYIWAALIFPVWDDKFHSQVHWKLLLLLNWAQVQLWFFFPSFILLVSLSLPRNISVSLGCSFIVETLASACTHTHTHTHTHTPVEFSYHCNPWGDHDLYYVTLLHVKHKVLLCEIHNILPLHKVVLKKSTYELEVLICSQLCQCSVYSGGI
jgi:hypothetical protein